MMLAVEEQPRLLLHDLHNDSSDILLVQKRLMSLRATDSCLV